MPSISDPLISIKKGNEIWRWRLSTIWMHSKDLPVTQKSLSSLGIENWKFKIHGQDLFTKDIPSGYKRLWEADLNYPIIFASTGTLIDGMHRAAKAWLSGMESIKSVQFRIDPPPERIENKA